MKRLLISLISACLFLTFSNHALAGKCNVYKITASSLNIRTGVWGSIVGSAARNQLYGATGRSSGDWRQLWFDGYRRWAHKNYLQYQSNTNCRTVSSTTWLNVRTGPSTGYGKVGSIPHGSVWPIIGSSGSWKKIYFKGALRYAYTGDYLIDHWKTSPLERYANFWNRSDVKKYNNCYAFATNKAIHRDYAFNRNYKSGSNDSDYWPQPANTTNNNSCSTIKANLRADGLQQLSSCNNSCGSNSWKVSAFRLSQAASSCYIGSPPTVQYGYHVMKQLSNGYWLHKNGTSNVDYARKPNGTRLRNHPPSSMEFCTSQHVINNRSILGRSKLSLCGCFCANDLDNIR